MRLPGMGNTIYNISTFKLTNSFRAYDWQYTNIYYFLHVPESDSIAMGLDYS